MGDTVSGRRLANLGLANLGLASLALAMAAGAGTVLLESGAQAAAQEPAPPGRELFTDWSCGSCHTLKDAGGTGHVGPALDGAKLTKEFVLGRITNGQGAMPSFGGMLSDKEIDELASYIAEQSNK